MRNISNFRLHATYKVGNKEFKVIGKQEGQTILPSTHARFDGGYSSFRGIPQCLLVEYKGYLLFFSFKTKQRFDLCSDGMYRAVSSFSDVGTYIHQIREDQEKYFKTTVDILKV